MALENSMKNEPNYNRYSKEELEQALESIDKEKFPERVQSILKEIKLIDKREKVYEIYSSSKTKVIDFITLSRFPGLDKFSLAICLWFIFFPVPYGILLFVLLLLPFIGIILNGLDKPSISTLVNFRSGGKIDVADFIDLPALAIFIRILFDYTIDTYSAIFTTGSILLILIFGLLIFTHKFKITEPIPNKLLVYLMIIGNLTLYSYSSVVAINCTYDYSDYIEYSTTAIDKHIYRGKKHTSYFVTVKPWGHHREIEDIRITSSQYFKIQPGDLIQINYHEGLLGIKWFGVAN